MDNEGVTISGEEGGTSANPEIKRQKQEEKAKLKGWKPLSEFGGDEEDFVDAKEFLSREPLLETIRDLKKHIKTQRERTDQDMQVISTQFSRMSEQAYKRALSDLVAQRDMAIEDKDTDVIHRLDAEIDVVKEEHKQAALAAVQVQNNKKIEPTEEMIEWREKNTWFDSDQELQDEAVAIGVGYLAKNPGKTQKQMLTHVTDRIKKIYAEKFPQKHKETEDDDMEDNNNEVQKVERVKPSGPKLGSGGKGKKITVNDLSEEDKQVMRTLLKKHVLKDIAAKNKRTEQEEFLAQYTELR